MQFSNSLSETKEETEKKVVNGEAVVRLKVSADQEILGNDLVRGNIRVNTNELEDKILMKRDGMPTYHFANVVDDHLMNITTVIRGEEWLPSLPIHMLLYEAFGWEPPKFMHLPLILNPSGKGKLSKRDGDKNGYPVFPLRWEKTDGYREKGFLSEAHLNYIAQLGWSPNVESEVMSLKEMEDAFDVAQVQKGGARFDFEKAKWVNQQHINKMDAKEIMQRYPDRVERIKAVYGERTEKILTMIKERLVLINDLEENTKCFVEDPTHYDEKSIKRIQKHDIKHIVNLIKTCLVEHNVDELKEAFIKSGEINNVGLGTFMQVTRVAVVGSLSGPDLFGLLEIIGKDVTLKRLERLIDMK